MAIRKDFRGVGAASVAVLMCCVA